MPETLLSKNSGSISPHISRSIDVIRGAAALGVIYGHSMYGFSLPVELNGAFWVWIFLPISGYLVGRGFLPGGYGLSASGHARFLMNRGLRIIPLAYVALVLGIFIFLGRNKPLPNTVIRQFIFISPLNAMSLSGPLWTVAAEMQFYVLAICLVPLTIILVRLGGPVLGFVWFLVAAYGGQQWVTWIGDNASQPRTLLGNIALFIFGIYLAAPSRFKCVTPPWVKGILVILAVAEAWYLQNYKVDYFWRWGAHDSIPLGGGAARALFITFVVLVITPTHRPTLEISAKKRSPIDLIIAGLAWCGFYTYGIYVWHAVIAIFTAEYFDIKPGFFLFGLLLLAVGLAPLSYRWIEQPFLRLKVSRR